MKKIITLHATAGDADAVKQIHAGFSQTALDFAHLAEAATVSMYDYDENTPEYDGDYHDDQTLFRVMKALQQAGEEQGRTISAEDAQDIIRVLLNCGILFRERRPDKTSEIPADCKGVWCTGCSIHLKPVPDIEKNEYVYKLPPELNPSQEKHGM